ncbi:MAG: HAMP domain-containing protein [Burkholderiales bacterium]|nr:HAMP domain-containing protein [Burkholderiales bacterium]
MRWPQSLLWRTFLLLALLSLASTAGWFLIFRAYEQEPRARQIAQNLVSTVNLTRAALLSAQAQLRRELLAELAARENIQVYPAEPGEALEPAPEDPLVRLVFREVREQLGEDTRFAYRRDGVPGFWVSFDIDGDEYWVRVPMERLERQLALQWLGWGALALALSLIAAYWVVSRLSGRLERLARAAGELGRGRSLPAVPEEGPAEMRALSRAFNQMTRDLARLEQDRALILAGVSHDLRTPLARLRLGVEMSAADDSLREGMITDIEEMDRIIGQFLEFARLGGGGKGAEAPAGDALARVELSALASEVIEHYARLGYAIGGERAPDLAVRGRPQALRRALHNLADNAIRYGAPPLELCLRPQGRFAVIEMLDRGPGIPESEAERMKLPFTRLDSARGGVSGSGLGLAIVNRIAQAHGGRLEIGPREGGGLAARLVLPGSA